MRKLRSLFEPWWLICFALLVTFSFAVTVAVKASDQSAKDTVKQQNENQRIKLASEKHEQGEETSHSEKRKKSSTEKAPGHSHEKANVHGGKVTMTTNHHFEVVYKNGEIQVWGYDKQQNPISLSGVQGSVLIKTRSGESKELDLEVHSYSPCISYLESHYDELSEYKPGNVKLTFTLKDVEGASKPIVFTQTYEGLSGFEKKSHSKEGHHEETKGEHNEESGHHGNEGGHH